MLDGLSPAASLVNLLLSWSKGNTRQFDTLATPLYDALKRIHADYLEMFEQVTQWTH